jgi:hypothetical protein
VLADHQGDTVAYAVVAIVCASLLGTLALLAHGAMRPAAAT